VCGIAGILWTRPDDRLGRDLLARMATRLAHRGPDAQGVWLNGVEPSRTSPACAMAFRRLAILDTDARASQPMLSHDGRHVLVFNGEIYNFRDLRAQIDAVRPHAWRTTGDSEVLLEAFARWGIDCLSKLNGMYAFAVWDTHTQTLTLARDRMGQKPLFVLPGPHGVAFASEIAALRDVPWFSGEIGTRLGDYLAYGYVADPDTIYADVFQVEPSSWWRYKPAKSTEEPDATGRYFNPAHPALEVEPDTSPASIRSHIERAVERQMISDVPLGVFLSGGIDSSVVALCARKLGPVRTFTIGFDDPRYDESPFAREVASHLGTQHHEARATIDLARDLVRLVESFGQPFADSSALPTHLLARETRRHVTVALSGDGGDELFGGYDRYRAMALARQPLLRLASLVPWWKLLPRKDQKSKLSRLRRLLERTRLDDASRYDAWIRVTDRDTVASLLSRTNAQLEPASIDPARVVGSCAALDRTTYLPFDLLTKVDRCSMLHSLEVRSPMLDHEVVALASRLSDDQLIAGGGKRMLREAFASDLPASVFGRPKRGFAVPVGAWLRGDLRTLTQDLVLGAGSFTSDHLDRKVVARMVDEHMRGMVDHTHRVYSLLVLEVWWRSRSNLRGV
jgi:asparagine synthase (glutamine-hydrolysing)